MTTSLPSNSEKTRPSQFPGLSPADEDARGWRETVESLVVALILAMLIRTFEAEAFVIPTGSMAPTLMGAHKDVKCPECLFWYQAGDSERPAVQRTRIGEAVEATCPMCGYHQSFNPAERIEESTFSGDRILVNKFAYDFGNPERWDVIVFKYPGNAKVNYIKRLIGLPGETIRIRHGDIFTRREGDKDFQIARKPSHKLVAMLQNVHDTSYVPQKLVDAQYPSRWETLPGSAVNWTVNEGGRKFQAQSAAGQTAWLAYQHRVPTLQAWEAIEQGQSAAAMRPRASLIRDFYAYNSTEFDRTESVESNFNRYWVGDLAMEAEFEVKSSAGTLDLVLIEAGRHHRCRINLADGAAELAVLLHDDSFPFDADAGSEEGTKRRLVSTGIRGPGLYRLRWANVDDELTLWVNGSVVKPGVPATYQSPPNERPYYRAPDVSTKDPGDPGDLAPVRIGVTGGDVVVNRLRVLRDIYYLAVSYESDSNTEYDGELNHEASRILEDPDQWAKTPLFADRRTVEFKMAEDQFMPLGDNSPYSNDARLWSQFGVRGIQDPWREPFFRRELLIGKAFVVYFPHMWYSIRVGPQPLMPSFEKMRRIQ